MARLLEAVTVALPLTLTTHIDFDSTQDNGVRIAQIAEQAGIATIAVHGRTRAWTYLGAAQYDTMRTIKAAVRTP